MSRHNKRTFRIIPVLVSALANLVLAQAPSSGEEASRTPAADSEIRLERLGVIIPIDTEITDITADSVRRRIEEAQKLGAATIIFELDTPGGLVTSTFDIADQIRNLTDVQTVAWVNTTAHSGGAIVAIACEEIVMARSSRMGDAQVIFGNPVGAQPVPEELKPKITTPVLADVRASAQMRGYSLALCEALVDPDLEVWWLENTKTGEREFVFRDEKLKRLGETPPVSKDKDADDEKAAEHDIDPPRLADAEKSAVTGWKIVDRYYDVVLGTEVKAVQPVVRDDQLLQMSASEAYAYGFSKGVVTKEPELLAKLNLGALTRLSPLWSEYFALWMTSMWVRGFLLVLILLGAYVEFHTPGVGVPGLVALVCLAIFVGAPYLTGLANVWEILCIVLGLALLLLEVFVIPGFGVAGISGLAFLLIGLLATFIPDEPGRGVPFYIPSLPSTLSALKYALLTVLGSTIVSMIGMVMLGRYLPRMPIFSRVIAENPTPSQVAADDPYRGVARVGDLGETIGPLHPTGKARFAGHVVDVVTQGEYVGDDLRVEVIERRGNRVVVRAIT